MQIQQYFSKAKSWGREKEVAIRYIISCNNYNYEEDNNFDYDQLAKS